VLMVPFESELFSSVNMVEAMVFGLPHIVTDLGEPADIVNRWGAGVKVPPKDPAALSKAMSELARNDAMRAALSQKARTAAIDFSVDSVAERLTQLYVQVAQPDHASSQRVSAAG